MESLRKRSLARWNIEFAKTFDPGSSNGSQISLNGQCAGQFLVDCKHLSKACWCAFEASGRLLTAKVASKRRSENLQKSIRKFKLEDT